MTGKPAVFLDRDGTLNREIDHLSRVQDLVLLPGAGDAVARLREAGYPVIVITNQSAVARGLLTETELGHIHRELRRQLAETGAALDGIYHCPHHPQYGEPPYRTVCACRKPEPGLLLRAAEEHNLDLTRSVMVGDSFTDIQAGRCAGCQTALVRTGYGAKTQAAADAETLSHIACIGNDLSEVTDWILQHM